MILGRSRALDVCLFPNPPVPEAACTAPGPSFFKDTATTGATLSLLTVKVEEFTLRDDSSALTAETSATGSN